MLMLAFIQTLQILFTILTDKTIFFSVIYSLHSKDIQRVYLLIPFAFPTTKDVNSFTHQ